MADFFARTEQLAQQVGSGTLRGEFAADKVYAVNMHEQGWRNFLGYQGPKEIQQYHQGGGPKFVESVWKEKWADWYQSMADQVLEGTVADAMEDAMKDFDEGLKTRAPVRDGELRASGTYTVYDGSGVRAHKPSGSTYEA